MGARAAAARATAAPVRIVTRAELAALLDRRAVVRAVRSALVDHAEGRVQATPPGRLVLAGGAFDLRSGHRAGKDGVVVTLACRIPINAAGGLPADDGFSVLLDAATGRPRMVFLDGGAMTGWRTAAAAATAAGIYGPTSVAGVVGTGRLARLALEWLPLTLGCDAELLLWGRDAGKAAALAAEVGRPSITPVRSLDALFSAARVVVTATSASRPLFGAETVRSGTHLVALGADRPGRQELPCEIFARASAIFVDDLDQCLDGGEFGVAVRARAITRGAAIPLGAALSQTRRPQRPQACVTIADLTGLAAQDLAIAEWFAERLAPAPAAGMADG